MNFLGNSNQSSAPTDTDDHVLKIGLESPLLDRAFTRAWNNKADISIAENFISLSNIMLGDKNALKFLSSVSKLLSEDCHFSRVIAERCHLLKLVKNHPSNRQIQVSFIAFGIK